MSRCVVLLAIAAAACGKDAPPQDKPAARVPKHVAVQQSEAAQQPGAVAESEWKCDGQPFEQETTVPEASGAGWLVIGGKLELVVVGDSGNHGAYGIIDPDTGKTIETGKLPLGSGSDDIEGVAVRGGVLYGLTSAGWMRVWKRDEAAKAFTLVDGPYAIGPVDPKLPHQKAMERPPEGDGIACELERGNCGHDFEGLAILDPAPAAPKPDACVGFAAGKADGKLFCLVEHDGRFAVSRGREIAVASPSSLADCAFDETGVLWAGLNSFGLSRVFRIEGATDPAHAKITSLGPLGPGFPEVIAVRGDTVYRMSDTGGTPSLMAKFRCRPPTR